MRRRSKLLDADFYDSSMYSPESKPRSYTSLGRNSMVWLRASVIIIALLISLLAFSCKRDEAAVAGEVEQVIDVKKVSADIAAGINNRIKAEASRHFLIARSRDGRSSSIELPPYSQMIESMGSESAVIEAIRSIVELGINSGAVEFGLMKVAPDPFNQAAK